MRAGGVGGSRVVVRAVCPSVTRIFDSFRQPSERVEVELCLMPDGEPVTLLLSRSEARELMGEIVAALEGRAVDRFEDGGAG